MNPRWFPCLTLLALLLLPSLVRPADAAKTDTTPTIVLRVRSIDTVIENAKFLAALAGKEDLGNQVEALIKAKIGPKGLEGIDIRRPIGMYTRIGKEPIQSTGVVMLPIADEKAFLSLLENLNVKAEKNAQGLYTVQAEGLPPALPVVFRFANGYAYFTALNVQAVEKANLIPPGEVFPRNLTADISGSIRLDRIPKATKEMALDRMKDEVAKAKERREPGETDAQMQVRLNALDAIYQRASDVLRSGREVAGQLNIDRSKKDLVIELSLDAQADSVLSKDIRQLADTKSLFAGLVSKDAAMAGLFHAALPTDLSKALEKTIDEAVGKALDREKDKSKRAHMEKFIQALKPTLTSGVLDAGFSLRGPSEGKLYTLVMGLQLENAQVVEKAVRGSLKDLQPQERAKIKLDADSVGAVKIHRIDAQDSYDKGAKEAFGDNPIYVAFRSDAMLVALGEDGLSALKTAIPLQAQAAPPLLFEVSMARLARSMAKTEDQKKVVQDVFGAGDPGLIRLTVEGGPALRLRFSTSLSVFQFGVAFSVKNEASN